MVGLTLTRAATLGLLVAGLSSTTSCSHDCGTGFAYEFAPDAHGPSSPRAALGRWLGGDHEGAPETGWRGSTDSTFTNGDWRVEVAAAPAGGYLVVGGSCSAGR